MADSGLRENAEKALDAATDGVAAAREKFSRVTDDLQDRYKKVSQDVRRGAERASKEIRRTAAAAADSYQEAAKTVQKKYHKVRKDVVRVAGDASDYVRENPGKAVLIAAGIGFLLGLVVRRRDEDED
jgi:ElaB/YqjD/DUF883 family membrane-anchored ribosome-binding protein